MPPEVDEQTPPANDGVTLSKAEHDRLQAAARQLAKAEREREAREAADAARRERETNDAEALRAQLAERDRRDALRDAITERGLTPSQTKLALSLADLSAAEFDAAAHLDTLAADYADIFAAPEAPPTPEPTVPTPPPIRRGGPAPAAPRKQAPFEGYISPEDYTTFPQEVRLDPKFRERVAQSRRYWPTTFNPKQFPQS